MHHAAQAERPLVQQSPRAAVARVLVIEDDPGFQDLVSLLLRDKGYEGFFASSGREGLRLVRSLRPDLVLIDLVMPGMNGFEVFQALRACEETKHVPILLMSGMSDPSDLLGTAASALGSNDFLRKPFGENEFLSHVRRLLEARPRPGSEARPTEVVKKGHWEVDFASREVRIHGRRINGLTAAEFEVLAPAYLRSPAVASWQECGSGLRDPGSASLRSPKPLRVHVNNIRRKLGKYGACLTTRKGVGLLFDPSKA